MLEISCLAIVLVYIATRCFGGDSRVFLLRFVTIAIAGFVGETSMIAAYKTYAYSTLAWTTFLDARVPVVIVLVWPVVIDSAMMLARAVALHRPRMRPLVTALIVLADAALIEPIAVRAKLWSWTEPGIFDVPPIGIVGWAIFAFFVAWLIETRAIAALATIVVAPLLTHATVLVSWWLVFRWMRREAMDPTLLVISATAVAVITVFVLVRRGIRVPVRVVLQRAPGALFFFLLLVLGVAPPSRSLVLYAAAFAIPYAVLVKESASAKSSILGGR